MRRSRLRPHDISSLDTARLAALVADQPVPRQNLDHLSMFVRVPVRPRARSEGDICYVLAIAGVDSIEEYVACKCWTDFLHFDFRLVCWQDNG